MAVLTLVAAQFRLVPEITCMIFPGLFVAQIDVIFYQYRVVRSVAIRFSLYHIVRNYVSARMNNKYLVTYVYLYFIAFITHCHVPLGQILATLLP
jgi:hypothetical protein